MNKNANIKSKKFIHFIIGCAILLCSIITVNAQQIPVYSQYTFSPFLLNPANAGSEGYTIFTLISRNQWVGIEGAPRLYSASAQTRIMKRSHMFDNAKVRRRNKHLFRSGKVGLGVSVQNFHAGQIDQTGAQFTYAYHYNFRGKSQISMGVSCGFLRYKINTSKLELTDMTNDPVSNNKISYFIPDADAGIYYSDQQTYIGFSVIQLFQASINFSVYEGENLYIYRQYYLVGGYKFNLNKKDNLETSFYLKFSEQINFQMDASLKYIVGNIFWIGLGYRSGRTFICTTGVRLDKFYFGYAYDFGAKGISNYSFGSHEIMLAIKLGNNSRRYRYLERY